MTADKDHISADYYVQNDKNVYNWGKKGINVMFQKVYVSKNTLLFKCLSMKET